MKLSARLEALVAMVGAPYPHIWDCCCDHGYLGYQLLETYPDSVIHFVDVVPLLVAQVDQLLTGTALPPDRWQTHCVDLKTLILPDKRQRHLMIIAGVGGDLMVEMVTQLLRNNKHQSLDFLLCPIRQLYKLRTELNQLGLGLVDEAIVKDGRHFYELIYVSTGSERKISSVGDMWDLTNPVHREYLALNIEHYERMGAQVANPAHPALQAYRKMLRC
ncbi:tRNA (adenine(22)-N(1))-methyltransferase TrmK [Neptuniibacter pectenicola]|uniref:tRNA (adenine(22)-N(1))-methyltransferase TrmK n=1 Tax=Neptuniibacter pectenicola TaxID=1806669 RepID=UPI00082DE1A5|nr:tRNA (adenine(22)-N(1))-methyltransferase TrmK [Neptuniibacter pectenicola]